MASTSSTSTTTTTTRPPTTTSPPLSGGYLAKWSIGGMLLRLTMTGPNTIEGLAIYRFLFDDGPSHGEAAISGTVSNNELVLRLKPADTGPRGWYLGTNWSGRLDPATGGFTIDLPSPTTGELADDRVPPGHGGGLQPGLAERQAIVRTRKRPELHSRRPSAAASPPGSGHEAVAPSTGLTLWPNREPSPAGGSAVGLAGRAIRVPKQRS